MQIDFKTTQFQWANNTEHFFKNPHFSIANKNTGVEDSSFFLKNGQYRLIISKKPENINKYATHLEGIPTLCGTEEINQFMEEDEDENHERTYAIVNEDVDIVFGKKFLDRNEFFGEKLYLYLLEM